jgi:hypothetical protein
MYKCNLVGHGRITPFSDSQYSAFYNLRMYLTKSAEIEPLIFSLTLLLTKEVLRGILNHSELVHYELSQKLRY